MNKHGERLGMKYTNKLTCIECGRGYEPLPTKYLCQHCGDKGLLDVEYDYERIKTDWSRDSLANNRELTMWRYSPLLPIEENSPRPHLRVGWTPTYTSSIMARELGLETLYIKDDGINPTGSLKDRASAMAVVKALEAGAQVVACSSTGNAASSLAGNIASLGGKLKAVIFVPKRAPKGKVAQLLIYGAIVVSVQGSYKEAFQLSAQAIAKWGWYNRNAAINPFLLEGKKTITLELAEQLNWEMPDWVVFSVGDGCTIGGAWKGLFDLKKIGFINHVPKLLGVQAAGCAPITEAFKTGQPLQPSEENSLADSIAVGNPRNPKKSIQGIKNSGGDMVNVTDGEILDMMSYLGRKTGIFGEPAGVAGLAGLKKALNGGIVKKDSKVAIVITGNGLKDIDNALKAVPAPHKVAPNLKDLTKALSGELTI